MTGREEDSHRCGMGASRRARLAAGCRVPWYKKRVFSGGVGPRQPVSNSCESENETGDTQKKYENRLETGEIYGSGDPVVKENRKIWTCREKIERYLDFSIKEIKIIDITCGVIYAVPIRWSCGGWRRVAGGRGALLLAACCLQPVCCSAVVLSEHRDIYRDVLMIRWQSWCRFVE